MYFEKSKGFPQDFLWGSASAAYQVEGGWDLSLIHIFLIATSVSIKLRCGR